MTTRTVHPTRPATAATAAASAAETATVEAADGARLAAYLDGPADAAVTVVLAHGWTLDATSWRGHAELLAAPGGGAAPVRVVRYDQRGHGRSESGTAEWTIDQLGDDLARVLDALAPEGPVVLGGHSMGGMTVMALAAARPELFGARVRGVLLSCTSCGGLDLTLRPELPWRHRAACRCEKTFFAYLTRTAVSSAWIRGHLLPGPGRRMSLALYRRLLFGPDAARGTVLETARAIHDCPMPAVGGWFPALMTHDKYQALAALSAVPVEILAGTQDRLTPVAHARRLAEALPGARLHVEPRTGHLLHAEHPRLAVGRLRALCATATH
jgi:pimeloyl-ACP methyl ester carboxylesterase